MKRRQIITWTITAFFAFAITTLGFLYLDRSPQVISLHGHSAPVTCLAFSPDSQELASGSRDTTIRLWNRRSGETRVTLQGHLDSVNSIAFSPSGKLLASGSADKTVKLWDVSNGNELSTFAASSGEVLSVFFTPDGLKLVTEAQGDPIKVYDITTKTKLRVIEGHQGSYESAHSGLAMGPNAETFATISFVENAPILWNLTSGNRLAILTPNEDHDTLLSLAFSPDGKTLATGTWQWSVIVWDLDSLKPKFKHRVNYPVNSVAFSPDGKVVAAGEDGGDILRPYPKVIVWDVTTGNEVIALKGPWAGIREVRFSPDGSLLAAASSDKTIKLWQVNTLLRNRFRK